MQRFGRRPLGNGMSREPRGPDPDEQDLALERADEDKLVAPPPKKKRNRRPHRGRLNGKGDNKRR